MGFTLNTKIGTSNGGSSATLSIAVPGSVNVGDLVLIACGQGTAGVVAPTSVDDGTSNLSLGTTNFFIDAQCTFAWFLSSPNSGSRTYTVTFPSAVTDLYIIVYVFTPSGVVTKDQEVATAKNIGTAINSGNLVNTGVDEIVFGACATAAGDPSTGLVGGAAATDSQFNGEGGLWYKAVSGTVDTSAIASSNAWVANAISFINTDSGSSSVLMGQVLT